MDSIFSPLTFQRFFGTPDWAHAHDKLNSAMATVLSKGGNVDLVRTQFQLARHAQCEIAHFL